MSFTQYLASRLLDHFCNDGAYTAGNVHIGLSSTTPNEDGTGVTEHTVGAQGYARVEMAAAAWNAATNADPSVKDNASPVTFPTATGDWLSGQNATHFLVWNAASGGNLLAYGALTTAKPVLNGDTASFATGALDITLD